MKLTAHNLIKYYGFIIILLILPTDITANKGLDIAIKSDRNFDGYEDSTSEMTMELISKKGDVVTRKLKFKGWKFLVMAINLLLFLKVQEM